MDERCQHLISLRSTSSATTAEHAARSRDAFAKAESVRRLRYLPRAPALPDRSPALWRRKRPGMRARRRRAGATAGHSPGSITAWSN